MTKNGSVSPILRHKAAIRRGELSLTFKCLQRDQLLAPVGTVFDYGCGHGEDITRLRTIGMNCDGWDPAWRPNGTKQSADVVNLGYVLNVIEDVDERAAALCEDWNLCQKALVVAARMGVTRIHPMIPTMAREYWRMRDAEKIIRRKKRASRWSLA